jgi:ComF family protein
MAAMSALPVPSASARAALAPLARAIEDFALPQRCPGCGVLAGAGHLLCDDCLAAIPPISFALCARCLVRGREPVGCARHPHHVIWTAWVYEERAALAVHALKFGERPGLAGALGAAIAAALPPGPPPDLVLGVPLHAARRRERGYDQAALLADAVAERVGAPPLPGVLVRARATRAQARLDAQARRENLRGAFHVRRPSAIAGRRVLVVDDVVTTGATLEACLDTLAAAGARAFAATLAWAQ